MRMPNLLATRIGRLTAFFFLYVTEGIPLGFAATAVATQLRRQDVGPAEIGAFVGSFYLPWAFKWAFGPFIDVFTSERLGKRRGWILGTQIMLIVTLLSCMSLDLPAQLGVLRAETRFPVRVIERPGSNISQGRNAAIEAAIGEVIASTDAGVRLDPKWLEKLVEPFAPTPSPSSEDRERGALFRCWSARGRPASIMRWGWACRRNN